MSHRTHETFTHDGYMSPMMGICRHGYMSHGYMSPNRQIGLKYCSFFIAAEKNILELKVLISSSDMEESLKTDVLEICTNACEKYVNDNQSVSIK